MIILCGKKFVKKELGERWSLNGQIIKLAGHGRVNARYRAGARRQQRKAITGAEGGC